jgi:hypothetical protein
MLHLIPISHVKRGKGKKAYTLKMSLKQFFTVLMAASLGVAVTVPNPYASLLSPLRQLPHTILSDPAPQGYHRPSNPPKTWQSCSSIYTDATSNMPSPRILLSTTCGVCHTLQRREQETDSWSTLQQSRRLCSIVVGQLEKPLPTSQTKQSGFS